MKNMKARVSEPNSPETDSQEFVLHTVTYTDDNGENQEAEVWAADPMDAIKEVKEDILIGRIKSEQTSLGITNKDYIRKLLLKK